MVSENDGFKLTIAVRADDQGRALDQALAVALDEFEDALAVQRVEVTQKDAFGFGQLYTTIGVITATAKAVRALISVMNVVVDTAVDLPQGAVTIDVNGKQIPLDEVTDEMIDSWLPQEPRQGEV